MASSTAPTERELRRLAREKLREEQCLQQRREAEMRLIQEQREALSHMRQTQREELLRDRQRIQQELFSGRYEGRVSESIRNEQELQSKGDDAIRMDRLFECQGVQRRTDSTRNYAQEEEQSRVLLAKEEEINARRMVEACTPFGLRGENPSKRSLERLPSIHNEMYSRLTSEIKDRDRTLSSLYTIDRDEGSIQENDEIIRNTERAQIPEVEMHKEGADMTTGTCFDTNTMNAYSSHKLNEIIENQREANGNFVSDKQTPGNTQQKFVDDNNTPERLDNLDTIEKEIKELDRRLSIIKTEESKALLEQSKEKACAIMRNMDEAYQSRNEKSKSSDTIVTGADRTQQLGVSSKIVNEEHGYLIPTTEYQSILRDTRQDPLIGTYTGHRIYDSMDKYVANMPPITNPVRRELRFEAPYMHEPSDPKRTVGDYTYTNTERNIHPDLTSVMMSDGRAARSVSRRDREYENIPYYDKVPSTEKGSEWNSRYMHDYGSLYPLKERTKLDMLYDKSVPYTAGKYYLPDYKQKQDKEVLQKQHVKDKTSESFYDTNEFQLEVMERRRRREQFIKEEEERIRLHELDLNRREARIQHMEQTQKMFLFDPLEEKERKLQEDRKRLEAREIEIYKREEALKERQLLKTDPLTQKENKSESITQPANKTELRKDIDKRMSIKGENNESTELKGISSENIYPEKQLTFPKFSVFSGEDPKPKSEATFEEWKYEVNCIRQEGSHTEQSIAQAIRKSLRGQAKCVLLPMGTSANIQDILDRLEGVFGNVASGESALQEFYMASQKQDESVAAWGLRLEEILQKAVQKGHVKVEDKNDMLRTKFWRSLRSDRLKNATRVHYESITKFEMLRRAVREEEHELKISSGIQHQSTTTHKEEKKTAEESQMNILLKKMASLEEQIKELNKPWWKRKQNKPDSRQQETPSNNKDRNQKSTNQETLNL